MNMYQNEGGGGGDYWNVSRETSAREQSLFKIAIGVMEFLKKCCGSYIPFLYSKSPRLDRLRGYAIFDIHEKNILYC